jgi:hypothetical protein
MNKRDVIDSIFNETKSLNEDQLQAFSYAIDKLLGETFILEAKKDDKTAYSILCRYYALANSYLDLININIKKADGMIYIQTEVEGNRFHLLKLDTVILLCLRKIEFDMLTTASFSAEHITNLKQLKDAIVESEVYSEEKLNTSATKFLQALNNLKHYKFIDFQTSSFDINDDDSLITINPPVSLLITAETIDNLRTTLDAYISTNPQEDIDDEETSETEAD